MGICYIVGAGDFVPTGLAPGPDDYVIAADGGYVPLHRMGIAPDVLVGDMDSLPVLPEGIPQIRFPSEKDDTDMGLALEVGYGRGYRSFALYGGGGGRIDHFLANLQCMGHWSRKDAQVRMVCRGYQVYALTDGLLPLPLREKGTVVSVFCHGDRAQGVTLRGLKYPLNQAELTCQHPLGVSNEWLSGPATVAVERGTLLIVVYDGVDP